MHPSILIARLSFSLSINRAFLLYVVQVEEERGVGGEGQEG
jgi:hypothetical protein